MGSQTSTSRHAPSVDLDDGQLPDFCAPTPLPPGLRLHREDLTEDEGLVLLRTTAASPHPPPACGSTTLRRSCEICSSRACRAASGFEEIPRRFSARPQHQQGAPLAPERQRDTGENSFCGEGRDATDLGRESGNSRESTPAGAGADQSTADGEATKEVATVVQQGEAEAAVAGVHDELAREDAAAGRRRGRTSKNQRHQQDSGDAGKEELIPCVFTWTHGGHSVYLTGSFNNWSLKNKIRLNRSGHEFSYIHNLPRGLHFYKFIVDDEWRFAPDQRTQSDQHGNINNVLDISRFARFDFALPCEIKEAREGQYHQSVPEPSEYSSDAPTIPILLGKSAHALTDPPPVAGARIPVHCLANHLFHDSSASRIFGPHTSCIATTHRWQPSGSRSNCGQRYTTYVYVTVNPLYPFPSAADDAPLAAAEDLDSCAAAAAAAAGLEVHNNPIANMIVYARRDNEKDI